MNQSLKPTDYAQQICDLIPENSPLFHDPVFVAQKKRVAALVRKWWQSPFGLTKFLIERIGYRG